MEQTIGLFCMCDSGMVVVNHNTSVISGELIPCFKRIARKVSLTAVNQIYVFHEAMNGCKNLKIH